MYYDNPDSKWVAGFGRLYLPWAVSLDTIDGGYVGRKLAQPRDHRSFLRLHSQIPLPGITNRISKPAGGSQLEGGSFESFHYTSTTGMAVDY